MLFELWSVSWIALSSENQTWCERLCLFSGNFIALTLFLSPVQTFVRIWKKGSVEQYSPVPYLATLFNCMAWALYGLPMVHPHSILLLTINTTAVFIELSFVIIFLIYASDKKQRLRVFLVLLSELVFMVLLAFLVIKLAHTYSKRSLIVGLVCVLGNIVMYASPLSVMIPNGLGLLFGSAQLLLYATYYKNTKRLMAERKARQLCLTEVVSDRDETKKTGSTHQNGQLPAQNNGT
ncbi:bidirectional sugar transporter SWEET7-like isoform X4 [Malus domestica]|uniref:bidirectional sugar transporter SWEET7-like isoform X4 n=1 Tax=Malus domestica TaxID=3750 RepID=UPI0039755803